MHRKLLRLTSSDSIRAQIQREEIDKIIQDQRRKKQEQLVQNISQISFVAKNKKLGQSRNQASSHPSFRSRAKQTPKNSRKVQSNNFTRYSLNDQISYFSVKKHYERIIGSVQDENVAKQLTHELFSQHSPRYKQADPGKTANFFYKVNNKDSRAFQYFEQLKKNKKQILKFHLQLGYC